MAQRLVREFRCLFQQQWKKPNGWVTLPNETEPLEDQVNRWVRETDNVIVDIVVYQQVSPMYTPLLQDPPLRPGEIREAEQLRDITILYVVIYQSKEDYIALERMLIGPSVQTITGSEPTAATSVGMIEASAEPEAQVGPKIPTVPGTLQNAQTGAIIEKDGQLQAGVFGVPIGGKLDAEDTEPAPTPLFSPAINLIQYVDMFGNI